MLLEKNWTMEMEKPVYEEWKRKKAYAFDSKSGKKLYSIDTPPPYVNTPIHIGHATTYTIMDFFARFKRMTGHSVLFPLGLDRNGLPIEMAAEKKFGMSLKGVSREEFLKLCEKVLEESSMASMDSFLRLGISFNSWEIGGGIGDVYLTDSPEYRTLTQATFIDLYKKGMIYEGTYLTSYCPGCRTTIADSEVDYADKPAMLNDVRFKVAGGGNIVIATTRPELLCTAGMVIFHPGDGRYKHLDGKTAIVPIFNLEIPIKSHPMANPEFGTGLVFMSRSAGDQNAIRFMREVNMEPEMAIDENGRMKKVAGFLEGMTTKEAREKLIEELRKAGVLEKQQQIMHRTPICERSKHTIEYIMVSELYLKQVELRKEMLEIAKKMKFFEESSRHILTDWINSVSIDWPISRNRYYATEVPLWYCKSCNAPVVPEKGGYYRPWKDAPPEGPVKCSCGSSEFHGDKRVLDTWFDSSISPLYVLKYPGDFFNKNSTCSLRPQGKEIVRTWLYYTLLRCYQLTKRPIFENAWIHYHVVDDKGKKMSKSIGNVIDPHAVLDKYGAEPFRLWCATEGNLAETDLRCSFERIEGAGKTLTKLWNVAKFVSQFPPSRPSQLSELDKWIIHEMNDIIAHTRERYEGYDFHAPATEIKHFIWETFASHYIELVKTRAYNHGGKFTKEEQDSAAFALNCCTDAVLKLLAPIVPMFAYRLYNDMRGKDVHEEKFPEAGKAHAAAFTATELTGLNSAIWKAKKDGGMSLKAEIKELTIPEKFKPIEKDMAAAHSTKSIKYGKEIRIVL